MAVRKASDSNLTGKKYNDASAGQTKIQDLPDAPTITTVTGTKPPSIAFTAANRGGTANSFTVTSTPGSITATGNASPIAVNGLTVGTSYTFKVKGKNTDNNFGLESSASNAVTPTGYALAQTFNSSTTYTVPTGVTKIGVVTISGGSGGGSGGGVGAGGGSGGRSGSSVSFFDYDVSGGQNYSVTVAGSGGTSSFGSLTSAAAGGNANSNFSTNRVIVNSVSGGSPGGGGFGQNSSPQGDGQAGTQSGSITYNISDIGPLTITHGGGGGGGGRGGGQPNQQPGRGGGGGGATFGGGGGGGGNWDGFTEEPQAGNSGGGGGAGNGPGGGGGGGGAGACNAGGGPGGAGAAGRILVYESKG